MRHLRNIYASRLTFKRNGTLRQDGADNRNVLRLAELARDAKEYRKAALLFEEYLPRAPKPGAIHVQCGHMFKETGDYERAEYHYTCAKKLMPEDADLALQFGHFYKVTGRIAEAELSYRRAIELAPEWPEPALQLGLLDRSGWRDHSVPAGFGDRSPGEAAAPITEKVNTDPEWLRLNEVLVPELAPRAPEAMGHQYSDGIDVRWFGHYLRTPWGMRDLVTGVDAIRGFCISATPIVEVRASLNGLCFYRGAPQGDPQGYSLKYENHNRKLRKYVFNIWYDFSNFQEGHYEGRLEFVDKYGDMRTYTRAIVVGPPLREEDYPTSDRAVAPPMREKNYPTPNQAVAPSYGDKLLEQQVNSRPSIIRLARRTLFAAPPKNVLLLRVDQLGDMVLSEPALRRLRELLPQARLVGLLTAANAALANNLSLFDEVIEIDFADDQWERRRLMPLDKQDELRRRLEPYHFDVAIDLSHSDLSRPLLLLSGAPFLMGFPASNTPWLTAVYEGITRDARNGMEIAPHSTLMLGMIEWFGVLLGNASRVVRRDDLTRDQLTAYGLAADDRFAVLHTGARLKFSQWPHYDRLAAMILENTDLKVVMLTDDPLRRSRLPSELVNSDRFQLLDQKLPFDDFDALLSFCTVFVGNDTGPSHLASLRDANVVNLFLARHNWNEWGHENSGYIISRRVPCAGCNIYYDPEECGKDFACIANIRPDEVFRTVMEFV